MIPVSLKIKNFLCFRDVPAVSFEGIHVACLCGENGAGKSSVFDAITWALWGETSRGRGDELIHGGQNSMEVELEFLSGEERYRVIRKQTRGTATRSGKSTLDIQVSNNGAYVQLNEHLKKETQAQINNLLHLDYDTFINSAMILQGRANEFSKKRPGERKEILANILDLSVYDALEEQARDLADKNKTDAAILERDVEALRGKVGDRMQFEVDQECIDQELREVVAGKEAIDKSLSDLRQRKEALAARQEQAALVNEQITSRENKLVTQKEKLIQLSKNIGRLKQIIADWPETEAKYLKCQQGIEDNKKRLNEVTTDIQVLAAANVDIAAAINDLNDKRAMLGELGASCPLCESELGADGCAKLRDKLTNELNAKAAQQVETNTKIAESKTLSSTLTKAINQDTATLKALEIPRSEAAAANVRLENEQATQTNLEREIKELEHEIAYYLVHRVSCDLSELPELCKHLTDNENKLREFVSQERTLRDRLAELSVKLQQVDEYAAEITSKESALSVCKEDESLYSELAKYFGKRGIQALIIEETLPEIETEANLLLGKMTDGRMALTIETQKDTKKGSTVETLEVKIADELGMRPYENFSGGECYRIDLALRIAISRLLVRRAGAAMPILIIDEGFGTQDSNGIEKLVEAISSIQDDFEKLFVITHLDELKDRFPTQITVSKGTDGSVITIGE
jgi:exonuclease SbcC